MYPVTFRTADKQALIQGSDDLAPLLILSPRYMICKPEGVGEGEMRLILYPMEEKYGESVNSVHDKDR